MFRRFMKGEKGVALIQFILVFPLMILLLSLVFDVGRVVYAKVNLQHLTSEMLKVKIISDEGKSDTREDEYYKQERTREFLRELIVGNKVLSENLLEYHISESNPIQRNFTYHHNIRGKNGYYGFVDNTNSNYLKYVTIDSKYKLKYAMPISKHVFGREEIILEDSITGIMYYKSDGWTTK